MSKRRRKRWNPPGSRPGTLTAHAEASPEPVRIRRIAYDAQRFSEGGLAPSHIAGLAPPEEGVLWLDVTGLSDPEVVRAVGDRFGFHRLALEDVLNVPQRPKVDRYPGHMLVVLREIRHPEEAEQLSIFLSGNVVVTFQERPGDAFEPVRERLRKEPGRLRGRPADFLLYALCDAVIDSFFPTLERIGDELDALEEKAAAEPLPETYREIRVLKRKLLEIRRAVWPARDAMNELLRDESGLVGADTKTFLRDCYDHTFQLMDMVETYREIAAGLVDEYMMSVSNRMNAIMKVLTIVGTIFLPLSFIASLYGMNFDPSVSPWNMPELRWRYGYPAAVGVMAAVAAGMVWFIRRKRWL